MEIDYYKKYEPIFGSWRIVREIGAGSYGKVFEIEREDFGYTYKAALKAVTIPQSPAEVENIIDDGKWEVGQDQYYFDGNGVMQTGTVELNEANYVFGDDGRFLRREYLNGDLMDYDFVNVYGIN